MNLFCLLLIYVLVTCAGVKSATQLNSRSECKGSKYNVVSLNKGNEPYWYQANFGNCLDGNKFKDIKVNTLHAVDVYVHPRLLIFDFPDVKDVFLDNNGFKETPIIWNLSQVQKISLSKNNITAINKTSFDSIPASVLIFSSNMLERIEQGSFGVNVTQLFLTCNNLSEFSPGWFLNPSKLSLLNMGGNRITTLADNALKDFTGLVSLDLRNNMLKKLGSGSLSGPTQMSILSLSYNRLLEIKPDVFAAKIKISHMDVQYNKLSFLHQGLMDKLVTGEFLTWANPWQCPCLDIINNWIKKNNKDFQAGLARDEDPSCVYALSFKDSCVPFPDEELYKTFLMNFETTPIQFC